MVSSKFEILVGDCVEWMRAMPSASVDAIITDPIYPEIDRPYGRISESQWHELMRDVVAQAKRILKPNGSAVFVLQPNSAAAGQLRGWLWEFMAYVCREWNMIQDVWWWNVTAIPTFPCGRKQGLMRPSLKACVWAGAPDSYRNQDAALWLAAPKTLRMQLSDRVLRRKPSGHGVRNGRILELVNERGGVTPFNVLPIPGSGAKGHPAATPLELCRWWTRYITKPGDTILDCFAGSGTTGEAALTEGRNYIGIERIAEYAGGARERLSDLITQERAIDELIAA